MHILLHHMYRNTQVMSNEQLQYHINRTNNWNINEVGDSVHMSITASHLSENSNSHQATRVATEAYTSRGQHTCFLILPWFVLYTVCNPSASRKSWESSEASGEYLPTHLNLFKCIGSTPNSCAESQPFRGWQCVCK